MDRRVVIVALAGFLLILILLVLAIRIFIGLISPGEEEPSPSPVVSVATPSPTMQTQLPIVSQREVDENTKEFTLENEGLQFSVREMYVEAYDRVRITFKVNRGEHTWTIKEFNATTRILGAGESETIEFVADRNGTFEYFCSVDDHRRLGMKGRLIVK